jgi:uncharacterized membrane protein YtjA (UPF0391 family)
MGSRLRGNDGNRNVIVVVASSSTPQEPRACPLVSASVQPKETAMLKWALIFLVVGVVMAALGFGGIGGAFVGLAKILFFLAIAIFIIFALLALFAGRKISDAL